MQEPQAHSSLFPSSFMGLCWQEEAKLAVLCLWINLEALRHSWGLNFTCKTRSWKEGISIYPSANVLFLPHVWLLHPFILKVSWEYRRYPVQYTYISKLQKNWRMCTLFFFYCWMMLNTSSRFKQCWLVCTSVESVIRTLVFSLLIWNISSKNMEGEYH